MAIVLSKAANDAKNASVLKQTTGLSDITEDGVDLTLEGFTLFDLGMEFLGKDIFAIGF